MRSDVSKGASVLASSARVVGNSTVYQIDPAMFASTKQSPLTGSSGSCTVAEVVSTDSVNGRAAALMIVAFAKSSFTGAGGAARTAVGSMTIETIVAATMGRSLMVARMRTSPSPVFTGFAGQHWAPGT